MRRLFILNILCIHSLLFFAQSYEWKTVKMGGGGYVTGIIASPGEKNLIYAKTDVGGAYRWNEADQMWIPLTDWIDEDHKGHLGIESIAIDPHSTNKVYMSAGLAYTSTKPAIFYSDDYGKTMKVIEVPFLIHGNGYGRGCGERLVIDPKNTDILYYGSREDGLWKSTDAANSWEKVTSFPVSETPNRVGITFIVPDNISEDGKDQTNNIYVGLSRNNAVNLYVSKDGGNSWTGVKDARQDLMPQRAVLGKNGSLIITYANGAAPHDNKRLHEALDEGALMKLNVFTSSWTDITPDKSKRPAMSGVTIYPNCPDTIVVSTTNTWWPQNWSDSKTVKGDEIFRSTDGGQSWTNLFGEQKIKLEVGEIVWGDPPHVDNPLSLHWSTCITMDPFNYDRVFVTCGNGLYMTNNISDDVSIWNFAVWGLEETVPLGMGSPKYGAPLLSVIGDYDGFRHVDLGKYPELGRHYPSIGTTRTMDFAEENPNIMVRVGSAAYVSDDNARTWELLPSPVPDVIDGSVAVSADGSSIIWCPRNEGIYVTQDRKNWVKSEGSVNNVRIVSDRVDPERFYFFHKQKMYYSSDGGKTFKESKEDSGLSQVRKITATPDHSGDIWVPDAAQGLYKVKWNNAEPSYEKINKVSSCEAVGFGKAIHKDAYPCIYIWGTVDNVEGIFRSDDEGKKWVRINDDSHQFGGTGNAIQIMGDPRVYGRVYMSSAGRGIIYGDLINGPDYGYEYNTDYIPEPDNK